MRFIYIILYFVFVASFSTVFTFDSVLAKSNVSHSYHAKQKHSTTGMVQPAQEPNIITVSVDGAPVQSSITATERIAIFVFTPPADGFYVIETLPSFTGSTIDTYIGLYGPDDPAIIVAEDDDSGLEGLSLIAADLQGASVYYVTVEGFDNSVTGAFQFSVTSYPAMEVTEPYLVSDYATSLPVKPAAIALNSSNRTIYFTSPFLEGDLFELSPTGEVRLVREVFSNVSTNGYIYPFFSTDIEYYNGFVFTALSDGASGEVVGINVENGDTYIYLNMPGVGYEAGLAIQNNRLLLSDGAGSANSVVSVDLTNRQSRLFARGATNSAISALETAANNQSVFGLDIANGYFQFQQGSSTAIAPGVLYNEFGFMAVDPPGENLYVISNNELVSISIINGATQTLIRNLPFANGDLEFGTSSSGQGHSLFIPAQNKILEVEGFSFQTVPAQTPIPFPTPQVPPTPTPTPIGLPPVITELAVNGDYVQNTFSSNEGFWYSFQTTIDALYLIETTTPQGSSVDPIMELYGPNNQTDLIESNDDFNQFTLNPRITLYLPGGLMFYVRVLPFVEDGQSALGEFAIHAVGPDVRNLGETNKELLVRYEFDGSDLSTNGWADLPGGFGRFQPGQIRLEDFASGTFSDSSDLHGLSLQVQYTADGQTQLVFLYALEPIPTDGKPLLLKMNTRASSSDAAVFLAALKGDLQTAMAVDGSLGMNQVNTSINLTQQNQEIVLMYKPDNNSAVTPIIQIVSTGAGAATTVWIDRMEIYRIDDESLF